MPNALRPDIQQCQNCGLIQPPATSCRACGSTALHPLPADRIVRPPRSLAKPILFSIITVLIACMVLCVLLNILASTGLNLRAIGLAVSAAILPTIVNGAVLVRVDRTEPESWDLRGLAFLWGAVIAVFIALILNTTALTIFHLKLDDDFGDILTATVAAPLVEESAKGLLVLLVLWFTRRHLDGLLDGLLLGATVGLGFAMTENIMYFGLAYHSGGAADVGSLFVIRCLVNGLGHAVWTSYTGAAIGWSRGRHGRGILRFLVLPVGWGIAVLGHATWNAAASLAIGFLTIGFTYSWLLSDWQAMIIAGIIGGLPFTIPPILTAFIIARLGLEQEEAVIRTCLPIEVCLGTLSPQEAAPLASRSTRDRQERAVREQQGKAAARNQIAFNVAATRLAFFHYHALRGERPDRADVRRAEQLRWQIATLRWNRPMSHDITKSRG